MQPIGPLDNSTEEETRVSLGELTEMLAQPLGLEKASEVVQAALRDTELGGRVSLSIEECRLVLDQISTGPGIIAIAANLAKVKLTLSRKIDDPE